jgi:protease I
MSTILLPLPNKDFDPTEAGVPWRVLTGLGHHVVFATPEGKPAQADPRMLFGTGLGVLRPILQADRNGIAGYNAMAASNAFAKPSSYAQAAVMEFDALLLPGGHAKGMREYLESCVLQGIVTRAFERGVPVGAICHGVLLAARARTSDGKSVLYGRKTTALTKDLELGGWALTALWLGRYYRTYPVTVQAEVTASLARPQDFIHGPPAFVRDSPGCEDRGFVVRDGNYLSARWPGDAHRFAKEFAGLLPATQGSANSSEAIEGA